MPVTTLQSPVLAVFALSSVPALGTSHYPTVSPGGTATVSASHGETWTVSLSSDKKVLTIDISTVNWGASPWGYIEFFNVDYEWGDDLRGFWHDYTESDWGTFPYETLTFSAPLEVIYRFDGENWSESDGFARTFSDFPDGLYRLQLGTTSGTDWANFYIGANNPPVVNAGVDASAYAGSAFVAGGSFTDPDSTSWTATVNYGDGTGTTALALNADKTFTLSHVYTNDGVCTVTVTVTDNHGGTGSDTLQVTVKSPLVELVNVVTNLPLSAFKGPAKTQGGLKDAMLSRLADIEAKIAAGDTAGAIQDLQNLRKHVDGDPNADKDDWIVANVSRAAVRNLIDALLASL